MQFSPLHVTSFVPHRRAALGTLVLAASLMACAPDLVPDGVGLPDLTEPADPEPEASPPVSRPSGPAVGLCPTEARWFQPEASFFIMENSFLGVTPNEGLVASTDSLGGSGSILRMDSGEVVAQGALGGLLDVDASWRRRLDHMGPNLAVRDLITAEELAWIGEGETSTVIGGALSPDGRRVASVSCLEGALSLEVRDIDTVTTVFHDTLGANLEYCPFWSEPGLEVLFGPSADVVLVGLPRTGALFMIDVAAGSLESAQLHTLPDEPPFWAEPAALLSLSTDASGSLLVSTGGDGLLRRFKLPGLIELGEPVEVGIVGVNLSVYAMPRLSSPSAVSPDGRVIAALFPADPEVEGERSVPMLLDAASGELLHVVEMPTTPDDGQFVSPEAHHAIGLAFSDSGRALVGRFGGGVGLWACDDFATPTSPPLVVLLDGPATVAAGQEATFTATHLGSDNLHSHTFFLDGEMLWGFGGLEREAVWPFEEPGVYEISVVVDDGAATGSAAMLVTVE